MYVCCIPEIYLGSPKEPSLGTGFKAHPAGTKSQGGASAMAGRVRRGDTKNHSCEGGQARRVGQKPGKEAPILMQPCLERVLEPDCFLGLDSCRLWPSGFVWNRVSHVMLEMCDFPHPP